MQVTQPPEPPAPPAPTPEEEPLTPAEIRALAARVAELEQALAERADADTPKERKEAADEVADAERELAALAERIGLEPAQVAALRELVKSDATEATEATVRKVIEEEYEVREPEPAPPAESPPPAATLQDLQADPDAPPATPPAEEAPPADEPPDQGEGHWFHKPLFKKESGPSS